MPGKTPVWARADIAKATRDARRAAANPAQAPSAPDDDEATPAHRSTAQPRRGARSATRGAETPQTATPAEPPRHARIIRPKAKRADGARATQPAVGVFSVSRRPARNEVGAAERVEPTPASVFGTAPGGETRPDRGVFAFGRGVASIPKKRRLMDQSEGARTRTTQAAEGARPVDGVTSEPDPQPGRRWTVRLSLPQNGRGGRD